MRIRGPSGRLPGPLISRVAAIPSIPGIRMSIRMTSGSSSVHSRTAWAPSAAVPTTSKSA